MGQGQGPPGATRSHAQPAGRAWRGLRGRAKRTLDADTARPSLAAGGMTTRSGAKRAPEGAAPLPAGEAEGARGGKPLALTSNFGPSGPSEIPRSGQAFLDTKNIACYPPKTTLGFYPQKSEFLG